MRKIYFTLYLLSFTFACETVDSQGAKKEITKTKTHCVRAQRTGTRLKQVRCREVQSYQNVKQAKDQEKDALENLQDAQWRSNNPATH